MILPYLERLDRWKIHVYLFQQWTPALVSWLWLDLTILHFDNTACWRDCLWLCCIFWFEGLLWLTVRDVYPDMTDRHFITGRSVGLLVQFHVIAAVRLFPCLGKFKKRILSLRNFRLTNEPLMHCRKKVLFWPRAKWWRSKSNEWKQTNSVLDFDNLRKYERGKRTDWGLPFLLHIGF